MQSKRAKRLPLTEETPRQFRGDMLCIRRRSSVSRDEQLATFCKGIADHIHSPRNGRSKAGKNFGNLNVFVPNSDDLIDLFS